MSDIAWLFEPTFAALFEKEYDLACSSCGLTMKQTKQLSELHNTIALLWLIHSESQKPDNGARIRWIVETALMQLGEQMVLTNEA